MEKWILRLINLLPKKMIIDLLISTLRMLAEKTDNEIDDGLVEIFEKLLYAAIGE